MARYVDGFLLPVPRNKVEAYRKISRKAGKVWREHGALEYRECAGDDLKVKMGRPSHGAQDQSRRDGGVFLDRVQVARASRSSQREMMKDPRIAKMMDPKAMPFDVKRMAYGGFSVLVDL